jgi:hypothetical protein
MRKRLVGLLAFALCLPMLSIAGASRADATTENWPEVFDPQVLRTLSIAMSAQDWDFIRKDLTETYLPGWFSADGETPIFVAIRRKSSRALPSEANPIKVGLKIDINEYVDGQTWRGLTKLSLENGADSGVVEEGLAWAMHRLAGETFGFPVAFANWVRVNVNGQYIGVYVSAEQRDKQALRQRDLWAGDETWLYEQDGGDIIIEEGDPHSPAVAHLCYSPFRPRGKSACAIPNDAALEADLRAWVHMDNFLAQCAAEALTANTDALCSHGKNTFFVDFSASRMAEGYRRFYMPWDLDAVFDSDKTNANIYGVRSGRRLYQEPYESVILNHPVFRTEYNAKVLALTDPSTGTLSAAALHAFLDQAEALLGPSLASDPYPTSGAGSFSTLKTWLSARVTSARNQAIANTNPAPRS